MIVTEFVDKDGHVFSADERAAVREICDATEPEIRAYLPTLTSTVELSVQTGTRVIPETGDIGAAAAPGRVVWTVDLDRPGGVEALARSRLRYTLFHELHHLVRGWVMRGGERPTTFMHGVVCEGLATAFERDAAGSRPLWGEYPDDVRAWVDELLALPVSAPYWQWMFQHPDGRRWIGYRAGTYIADQAIRASGCSAAELAETPTDEISSPRWCQTIHSRQLPNSPQQRNRLTAVCLPLQV